eukprot:Phypoly_transcript_12883.p1 GENE.Phypoly_transcript_12883~~Phypoly_transcript_12883.p1  ORF type:complete len:357 (-),score=59.75 Phypoly_transcript_12883:33-1079(-)
MKTIAINEFGGADKLVEQTMPTPEVKKGDVRIKIHATSFNPVDWKIREGNFGGSFPIVMGHDSAGVIDAVGEGVTKFKVGDEVYAFVFGPNKSNGGYAEYVSLPQEFVAIKPKNLSYEDASSIPLAGLTAYSLITRAKVAKGDAVFVTGASGGVGSFVVQLLRHFGAGTIVTTAGSDSSAEYIHSHLKIPKEHIIRYDKKSQEDIIAEIRKLTKNALGFPIAIDLVGGDMKTLAFRSLRTTGHVLTIVEENDPKYVTLLYPVHSLESLFMKDATFSTIFIGGRTFVNDPAEWAVFGEDLASLAKLIEAGSVVAPKVTKVGNLNVETIRKAHAMLEDGHTKGKLVVSIP